MKEITFTVGDAVGQCAECHRVAERTYQFFLSGHGVLLCGQCLSTFISQVQWMLDRVEPNLRDSMIASSADTPSELRCRKCMDMLAAHITTYYRSR